MQHPANGAMSVRRVLIVLKLLVSYSRRSHNSHSYSPIPRSGFTIMELTRHLQIDSVSRLNPLPPHMIASSRSIAEAVEQMRGHRTGCVLITQERQLVGIFTERDLMMRVLAVQRSFSDPVAVVMTKRPVCLMLKDPLRMAIRKMEQGSYRHMPVIDESERPVGILSVKRIVQYLVEHFPNTIYNQPPEPHRYPDAPYGA